jgi:hypothetical protein
MCGLIPSKLLVVVTPIRGKTEENVIPDVHPMPEAIEHNIT